MHTASGPRPPRAPPGPSTRGNEDAPYLDVALQGRPLDTRRRLEYGEPMVLLLFLSIGCFQIPETGCSDAGWTPRASLGPALPANPAARAEAVAVLTGLRSLDASSPQRILIGQSGGHLDYEPTRHLDEFFDPVEAIHGVVPAILQVDYGYTHPGGPELDASVDRIVAHARAGGLVTMSLHLGNPLTGDDVRDRRYDGARFDEVLDPTTEAGQRHRADLARVADLLERLRDEGVVVLWRPYHEMNGSWWWYSVSRDGWTEPADFEALWRAQFDYFTMERDLDNLLWVYAANAQLSDRIESPLHFYPGDDVVDVVALDHYDSDPSTLDRCGGLAALESLDKPLGLAEIGPTRGDEQTWDLPALLDLADDHRIRFATTWHSYGGRSISLSEVPSAGELLDDPRIVTRDEVGDALGLD